VTYQHSDTFASLKNLREGISENLTSYQWLSTLDFFIESAIDPIATAYPDFLDNFYSKVVAYQAIRPSVKFSRNAKGTLPAMLFNSLTTSGKAKREHQKAMMLNRGVLFGVINTFQDLVDPYLKLHDPLTKIPWKKRQLLISLAESRTSPYLWPASMQVAFYAKKAYEFKELIVQKYVRMTLMSAKRVYGEINHRIKLDDVIQTYLVYLSKAIDRCDSRQGVLTTFIQTWFYSARAEVQRSLADEQHSSYEELLENGQFADATLPDCKYEVLQHLAATAKTLDPEGAVRFAIGIPEFLGSADLKVLHKAARLSASRFNPPVHNPKEKHGSR
jgi:hypothetical protein